MYFQIIISYSFLSVGFCLFVCICFCFFVLNVLSLVLSLNHLSSFSHSGLSLFSSTIHMATLCLLFSMVSTCQHTFWFLSFHFSAFNTLDYICQFCPFFPQSASLILLCNSLIVHPRILFIFLPFCYFSFQHLYLLYGHFYQYLTNDSSPLFVPFHFLRPFYRGLAYTFSMPSPFPKSLMISLSSFFPQLSLLTPDRYLLRFTMCLQHRDLKIV